MEAAAYCRWLDEASLGFTERFRALQGYTPHHVKRPIFGVGRSDKGIIYLNYVGQKVFLNCGDGYGSLVTGHWSWVVKTGDFWGWGVILEGGSSMIGAMAEMVVHKSDAELVEAFARSRSEEAFGEIVRRHINLVYSTALRRTKDAHLAEDVTQAVFFVLAKKAGRLGKSVVLAGWLYRTARFVSMDAIKMKTRRETHEREAAEMRAEVSGDETWAKISPVLESGMDALSSGDRDVILLRFFEGMEVSEIGRTVGISANTASKRLQRAVERLRKYFAAKGVNAPAIAIGPAIVAGAVHSAPLALGTACVTQLGSVVPALAKGAMSAGLSWLTAAVGVVVALVLAGAAYAMYLMVMVPAGPTAPPLTNAAAVNVTVGAARLSGPMEAVSAEQLKQIRAAIYVLRYYEIGVDNQKWMNAIRTLTAIGRPAVPELVAELDRTSRDRSLRALAFTLRAIGDPRACPALIGAIDRTVPSSSDFGLQVDDRQTANFMCARVGRRSTIRQLWPGNSGDLRRIDRDDWA